MYSCALWGDAEGGVRGDLLGAGPSANDLEGAQMRKIHHVLRAARVKPGDRLLEFGTGWGALAIEVCFAALDARAHACRLCCGCWARDDEYVCMGADVFDLCLHFDLYRPLRRMGARSTRSRFPSSRRSWRRSACGRAVSSGACGCI